MSLFVLVAWLLSNPDELLAACLTGDRPGIERFILYFTPILRRAVRSVLFGPRGFYGRLATQQDIDDVVQQVLVVLFQDGARVLRAFDPARGMSLKGYLCQLATREAHNFMDRRMAQKRGGPLGGLAADSDEEQGQEVLSEDAGPERALIDRQWRAQLEAALLGRLSDRGRLFYRLLYVEELEVEEITRTLQVDRDVVYTWRKRIRDQLVELARAEEFAG